MGIFRKQTSVSSFFVSLAFHFAAVSARNCDFSEFIYEYTQCDQNGERWRITLPKSTNLQCDNIPPPQLGVNCSFSCHGGHFLNLKTQQCEQCPPGSYSLGSAQRYEDVSVWPPGFSVDNFEDGGSQFFHRNSDANSGGCSNSVGWVIQGGEIRYLPSTCISRLSISLHLVKSGYIEFFYKMPKNSRGLVSTVDVRNEQCQSSANPLATLLHQDDDDQSAGDWRTNKLVLQRGQNLVTWTVANNVELTTLADIIYLPKVDVVGLPYTSSCTKCPSGTYTAKPAQTQCQSCQVNQFSNAGATGCTSCAANEYALTKSSMCIPKPPCQSTDFYPVFGRCQDGKQTLDYEFVPPAVCEQNGPLSAKKPRSDHDRTCQKCSAGMERSPDGTCIFCSKNSFSDGTKCQPCNNKTRPRYGYFLTSWEHLPPFAESSCDYLTFASEENQACSVRPSWIPMGDRVETATSRETAVAMELVINVTAGFFNPLMHEKTKWSPENPVATLTVEFETNCADESCTFYIVQEGLLNQRSFRFLAVLNGTVTRRRQQYPIVNEIPSRFILAFMRSGAANGRDVVSDKAVLYAFNLTNTGDQTHRRPEGGADSCIPCPSVDATGVCTPCPPGNYIDAATNQCVRCPLGTKLNRTSSQVGRESCVKCGANMESEDGLECTFSGKFALPDENNKPLKFDLSPLKKKTLLAEGIRVFAREGNSYFHIFNVSLFDEPVQCSQAKDTPSFFQSVTDTQPSNAVFCRSTAIPYRNERLNDSQESIVHVSPFTISDKLVAVTRDRSFQGFFLTDKNLEYDTMTEQSRPVDVQFFFEPTVSRVHSCKNGTIGVVTTRCEPTATNEPQVRLPRSCPDGSCDGCMFHVIVETSFACPICDNNDFEEIRAECIDGRQKVHWIPSKHCILSGAQAKERTEECASSKSLRLLLILACVLIFLLILIIYVFYKRNQHLQYRYMRIVEGKEPEEMETCGLESEDDDAEEDDASNTRVYFGRRKNDYVVGLTKGNTNRNGNNSGSNSNENRLLSSISDESD